MLKFALDNSWSVWISFSVAKAFLELLSEQEDEELHFHKRHQNREICHKSKLPIWPIQNDTYYGRTDGPFQVMI